MWKFTRKEGKYKVKEEGIPQVNVLCTGRPTDHQVSLIHVEACSLGKILRLAHTAVI